MAVEPTRSLSARLRFEILRRDDHTCRYCGGTAPDVKLTVDHVIPVALGGTHEPNNLVTACRDCNSGKTSTAPDQAVVEQVNEEAERWADAMKRAAEIQRQELHSDLDELRRIYSRWVDWLDESSLDPGWESSVRTFMKNGMTTADLEAAIGITAGKGLGTWYRWKYFCGVCWKIIRDRQEIARELLAGGA